MSFRIEEKILVSKYESIELLKIAKQNNFQIQYPKRKIHSIYFDNINYQSFNDSIEGSNPRKKIRIRHYPKQKKKIFFLEKKISSIEGRYKVSKKIDNKQRNSLINLGSTDNLYGYVYPICEVSYYREYFNFNNLRLSYDSAIKYSDLKNNYIIDTQEVIEIKSPLKVNEDKIRSIFPYPRNRFSKYCRALELLNLNV